MADVMTRPWTRPQDWISLVAGAYLVLSPLWVSVSAGGAWAMVLIGLAVVVLALIALARPGAYVDEWVTAAAGALAFLAPWLFGYADESGAAWTSWIVGLIVVISALSAVPISRQVAQRQRAA
ncbi:MAG TPA: SPW repeat protein [Natronosporangium sp.]|nr:SPW repeat protein [Natronosporangium sp.]